MRINKIITKAKMFWPLIKFSELILQRLRLKVSLENLYVDIGTYGVIRGPTDNNALTAS